MYVGRHRDPQQMLPGQFARRYRTLFVALFGVVIVVSALVGCTVTEPDVTEPSQTYTPTVITEDDPRWDCRTMGNLICGGDAALLYDVVVDAASAATQAAWDHATYADEPDEYGHIMVVTDETGEEHYDCYVVTVTAEDSRVECADGWSAES